MRILLDTHAFVWWTAESDRLSKTAYESIADETNAVIVSAASAWEIATKHRIGKLAEADVLARNVAVPSPARGSRNWRLPSRTPNAPGVFPARTVIRSTASS